MSGRDRQRIGSYRHCCRRRSGRLCADGRRVWWRTTDCRGRYRCPWHLHIADHIVVFIGQGTRQGFCKTPGCIHDGPTNRQASLQNRRDFRFVVDNKHLHGSAFFEQFHAFESLDGNRRIVQLSLPYLRLHGFQFGSLRHVRG